MKVSATNIETGAVMVEIAIGLPLFLAFVLILFWLGMAINSSASLDQAVKNGVELAATRGNRGLMGFQLRPTGAPPEGLINPIDDYRDNNGPFSAIEPYLVSSNYDSIGCTPPETVYQSWLSSRVGNSLKEYPVEGFYALAYVYAAMEQAVGGALRYPCDPELNDPCNGVGCLRCDFMIADDMHAQQCAAMSASCPIANGYLMEDRIGLRCKYGEGAYFFQWIWNLVGAPGVPTALLQTAEHWEPLEVSNLMYSGAPLD